MPPKPTTARIEVFRPGTFTPMEGVAQTYSAADLRAIADAYDFETAPAPIVVGHPTTDAPAYGWVASFEYDGTKDRLFANLVDIDPAFSTAVKAGRYKKVSACFFPPTAAANPVPGTWYPKHIGFLGGAAPAVAGLKNVAFAQDAEAVTFTAAFGERGFEETASLFRMIREFMIEKFGMEDADKALPAYRIEWLGEMEVTGQDGRAGFTAPTAIPPKPQEPAVTQPDPAFAAREADVSAREAALLVREAQIAQTQNAAFAESLVTEGRLLPALKDKLIAVLNVLPGHAAVSFSEGGEKLTAGAALRQIMSELPKIVSFGALDLGEAPGEGAAVAFAADGKPVDTDNLATHNKALEYQRAHPGTAYMDAVKAVS
jgi:hypothetical protein